MRATPVWGVQSGLPEWQSAKLRLLDASRTGVAACEDQWTSRGSKEVTHETVDSDHRRHARSTPAGSALSRRVGSATATPGLVCRLARNQPEPHRVHCGQ